MIPIEPAAPGTNPSAATGDHRFATRVGQTFALDIGLAFAGLLAGVIEARVAGPSGLRDFGLLIAAASLISAAALLGLPQSTVYLSGFIEERRLSPNVLLLSVVLGSTTALACGAVSLMLGLRPFGLETTFILLGVAGIPCLFVSAASTGILQGRYAIPKFQLVRAAPATLNLVLLFAAIPLVRGGTLAIMVAWLVAQATAAFLGAAIVVTHIKDGSGIWIPDLRLWAKLLGYGCRTHIGNVLKYMQYRADVLILGIFLARRQTGWYLIAIAIAEIPWRIPNAVGAILFPRIALEALAAERDRITSSVARNTLLVTAVVSGLLAVLAPFLINTLYGDDYSPATAAARVLLPGITALGLWKVLAHDLIARGKPGPYSLSAAVSLAVLAVCSIALIPLFGLTGGALASTISYLSATAVIVVAHSRHTGMPVTSYLVIRQEDFVRVAVLPRRMLTLSAAALHRSKHSK